MLLNLTNHPSEKWGKDQTSAAKNQWGEIMDMAFPQIDPNSDESNIERMVSDTFGEIRTIIPEPSEKDAIHLMGEQTFCFALISRLLDAGYNVVASTTERQKVILEDGITEQSVFTFKQFRTYRAVAEKPAASSSIPSTTSTAITNEQAPRRKKWWKNSNVLVIGGTAVTTLLVILSFIFFKGFIYDNVFAVIATSLGICADAAILFVAYRQLGYETIDIQGIGKFKVRRSAYDIQTLTNIINEKYYEGKNFNRKTLMKEYYKDVADDFEVIQEYPDYKRMELGNKNTVV